MENSKAGQVMQSPSLAEANQIIKEGISKRKTVLTIGNCWVKYEGRASSKLEPGERIIIIKSDGSILVHRPKDYSPVNWQPPGSLFRTRLQGDQLIIRAFRTSHEEVLEVGLDRIMLVAVFNLVDYGEFYLYADEEDMKQAILMQPSLIEEGFRPISSERPVEPGFIDILGMDKDNVLTVIEIKRKAANREAVLQLKKYLDFFKIDPERKVRGILVAPELARGAQKTLATLGLEFLPLSPMRCAEILRKKEEGRLTDFLKK